MKQYEIIVETQETVRYRVFINADSKLEAKNVFNSNKQGGSYRKHSPSDRCG